MKPSGTKDLQLKEIIYTSFCDIPSLLCVFLLRIRIRRRRRRRCFSVVCSALPKSLAMTKKKHPQMKSH